MFLELNLEKDHLLLAYQSSIKLYYDSVVAELAKNINVLQIHNVVSESISKQELEKLPRNTIDKILNDLREIDNETKKVKDILKKESEYREEYVESGKKHPEENLSKVIQSFSQRIYAVLEDVYHISGNDNVPERDTR